MASVQIPAPKSEGQDLSLHYAARNNDVSKIKELVGAGLDINDQESNGFTPLIFASSLGNLAAVKTLVSLGANTALENELGYTAYTAAMFHGDFRGATMEPFDKIMELTKVAK